jgi:hypothetical protein
MADPRRSGRDRFVTLWRSGGLLGSGTVSTVTAPGVPSDGISTARRSAGPSNSLTNRLSGTGQQGQIFHPIPQGYPQRTPCKVNRATAQQSKVEYIRTPQSFGDQVATCSYPEGTTDCTSRPRFLVSPKGEPEGKGRSKVGRGLSRGNHAGTRLRPGLAIRGRVYQPRVVYGLAFVGRCPRAARPRAPEPSDAEAAGEAANKTLLSH